MPHVSAEKLKLSAKCRNKIVLNSRKHFATACISAAGIFTDGRNSAGWNKSGFIKVDSVIHCFQSCFCLNFGEQKRETQYEMFFPGNNSLLTWLGNNYTNPLLEAGVRATLCMIHSRRDFDFNFCCYDSTCFDFFSPFSVFLYYYYFYFIVQTSSKLNH